MKNPTIDALIADVLAIHLDVQRHLQNKKRGVTPLQVKVLAEAVTSLNRFLIAWQTQAASKQKVVGLQVS